MVSLPSRISNRNLIRSVFLPCLVYMVLFFGASEVVEHWFYNQVSDSIIHLLHFVRTLLSTFFVACIVLYSLSKIQHSFQSQMISVIALLNNANDGVIAFDSEFRVLSMNPRASELLGSIYSTDFLGWKTQIKDCLSLENNFECRNPAGDRKLRVASLQSRETGVLLLLQDITEEKRMEQQWLITEKMASFGRMAQGLAHEIGTPLNIISGRAEMLQSLADNPNREVAIKQIRIIQQQVDRIRDLIERLLNQKENLSGIQKYSINDLIKQVLEALHHDLEHHNIQTYLHLQDPLPELFGFKDQIRQAILHLILNAIDATTGTEGVIEISTYSKNGLVGIVVADNGCGIPAGNLTRIFDPFFTTKEFGKGTGLGLSVASRIIQVHGGKIEVESQVEKGSTFTIELPVHYIPVFTDLALSVEQGNLLVRERAQHLKGNDRV